jgi:hypothetical protein
MKNNFLVEQSEKERILNQHKSFKKILENKKENNRLLITEQKTGKDLLDAAVGNQACRPAFGGEVKATTSGKGYVIRKIATYNSKLGNFLIGDIVYLYDNFTGIAYKPDPKDPTKASNELRAPGPKGEKQLFSWPCAEILYADDPALKQEEASGWYTKTRLDAMAKNGTPLIDFQQFPEDKQQQCVENSTDQSCGYTYKMWNGVKLFKPKRVGSYVKERVYDVNQKAFIDLATKLGYKFKPEIKSTDLAPVGDYNCEIVPYSDSYFTKEQPLEMCIKGSDRVAASNALRDSIKNRQTSETFEVKDCQKNIKLYWVDYTRNKPEPNPTLKKDVQACIDQHWRDLGTGLFNSGNKYYHNILKMFTGERVEKLEGKNPPDRNKTEWMLTPYNP